MYEIAAKIPGWGCDRENIACFDPTVVIVRLREVFPDMVVHSEEYAWRTYDGLQQLNATAGALRTAERDALRRGPIWVFELPAGAHGMIKGHAERYVVGIWDQEPIPEELQSRFLDFLEVLKFAPCVVVSCRCD